MTTKKTKTRKPKIEQSKPPILVVKSEEELRAAVGEERAEQIMQTVKKLAASPDRVQCRVTIEFEAPNAVTGHAACEFLRHVVSETIGASKWGHGSFESAVVAPDGKPPIDEAKPGPKPVSPLN